MTCRHAALLYDGGGLGLGQLRGKEQACIQTLERHITAYMTNMFGTLELHTKMACAMREDLNWMSNMNGCDL